MRFRQRVGPVQLKRPPPVGDGDQGVPGSTGERHVHGSRLGAHGTVRAKLERRVRRLPAAAVLHHPDRHRGVLQGEGVTVGVGVDGRALVPFPLHLDTAARLGSLRQRPLPFVRFKGALHNGFTGLGLKPWQRKRRQPNDHRCNDELSSGMPKLEPQPHNPHPRVTRSSQTGRGSNAHTLQRQSIFRTHHHVGRGFIGERWSPQASARVVSASASGWSTVSQQRNFVATHSAAYEQSVTAGGDSH